MENAVAHYRERRATPRVVLPEHPPARALEVEVRLLDLSIEGAGIEHLGLLRPGLPCTLELPATLGFLAFSTQVMWCAVVGAERQRGGERHLRARSGLRFDEVTQYQRTVLADALRRLMLGPSPAS